jgi:hypothetical protein
MFTGGSPLIPLVRFRRSASHARRVGRANRLPWTVWPTLVWGLILDGLGQMTGYAIGAGASRAKTAQYEFERVRFITEADRRELDSAEQKITLPATAGTQPS